MVKLSYEEIKKTFEDKECKLLTTKDEFIENDMNASSKYNIISSCGHNNSECLYYSFKNRGSGILCKDCISYKPITLNNPYDTEDTAINIFQKLISTKFNLSKMDEGTKVDFCINDKNTNIICDWLPFQLKSTEYNNKNTSISFTLDKKYYENILVILICIKPIKIWIFDGNSDIIKNKQRIHIGYKSKYSEYEVSLDNITEKVNEYYHKYKEYYNTIEIFNTPLTLKIKKEREYRKYREDLFNQIDFQKSKNYSVTDFKINNYNIQEKVGSCKNKNGVIFQLTKSNYIEIQNCKNKRNNTPYHIKDNDFYWLHYPDKSHFIFIPSNILFENGYLQNDDQINKYHLIINLSKIYDWIKPYIYKYESETQDKLLQLFENLNKIEVIEDTDVINTTKIIESNLNEVNKYNERWLKIEKKYYCHDCKIEICKKSNYCNDCNNKNRVIKSYSNGRPSYLTLKKELESDSFVSIGKKYNVSDNCIRKWLKAYEKYNLINV